MAHEFRTGDRVVRKNPYVGGCSSEIKRAVPVGTKGTVTIAAFTNLEVLWDTYPHRIGADVGNVRYIGMRVNPAKV